MLITRFLVTFFVNFLVVVAWNLNGIPSVTDDLCTVTSYSQIDDAISNCDNIVISNILVPAGTTLELNLKNDTILTFEGHNTFEYQEWNGPLLNIQGNRITIQGAAGHSIDGLGVEYWDGQGGNGGKTKPLFFKIDYTDSATFKNINLLNCPRHCVSISNSMDLTLSNWNIDCSVGDLDSRGHNTDGFGVNSSSNVLIENSVVWNQDDCIAVNQGSNMKFSGLSCYGGHGLSISAGMNRTLESANEVSDIVFTDSIVRNSRNGIHVKTHTDGAPGYIRNVTYQNIQLQDVTVYGINIQEDYENGQSTGFPKNNIPITGLTLSNISISLATPEAQPVYILCADGGCSDWKWSGISLDGCVLNVRNISDEAICMDDETSNSFNLCFRNEVPSCAVGGGEPSTYEDMGPS